MAEAGGPESAAARCPEESSDSEPEQEPGTPQKLIRKVSTSGQIRSKVKSAEMLFLRAEAICGRCFHLGGGGPFRSPRTGSPGGRLGRVQHPNLSVNCYSV